MAAHVWKQKKIVLRFGTNNSKLPSKFGLTVSFLLCLSLWAGSVLVLMKYIPRPHGEGGSSGQVCVWLLIHNSQQAIVAKCSPCSNSYESLTNKKNDTSMRNLLEVIILDMSYLGVTDKLK